jgi:hypothetical protein
MLVSVELGADFSAGCAHPAMRPRIPATHPHLPFVDRFMPLLSLSNQVSVSHRRECLFTAPISCAWQYAPGRGYRPSSAPIEAGYAASCMWTSENFLSTHSGE